MERVLKDKLTVISDEIKILTKSILAYYKISSKIEVVFHDCLFFNNLGEEGGLRGGCKGFKASMEDGRKRTDKGGAKRWQHKFWLWLFLL